MDVNVEYYLKLLSRINSIYDDMLNKKYESYDKLKDILKELTILKDEIVPGDNEIIHNIIRSCNEQISLINYLNTMLNNDLEKIRREFVLVEKEHFEITNKYIKGQIKTEDVRKFEKVLSSFKTILYKYQPDDESILEIAKMKSKVQHFTTEILEDEDVLRIAYSNGD